MWSRFRYLSKCTVRNRHCILFFTGAFIYGYSLPLRFLAVRMFIVEKHFLRTAYVLTVIFDEVYIFSIFPVSIYNICAIFISKCRKSGYFVINVPRYFRFISIFDPFRRYGFPKNISALKICCILGYHQVFIRQIVFHEHPSYHIRRTVLCKIYARYIFLWPQFGPYIGMPLKQ